MLTKVETSAVDFIDPAVVKTPEDIKKAESIVQFTKLLRKVYAHYPQVVEEVNAAIATGYYVDETVMVKDLLNPSTSPIYKMQSFLDRKAARGFEIGSFRRAIEKEAGMEIVTTARKKDYYFIDESLSIYFPYHDITQYYTYPVTTLPATTEADSAPAPHPLCDDITPETWAYCSQTVTVNDDYAFANRTHIVNMTADTEGPEGGSCSILGIHVGYVKVHGKHYDKLFSFTDNGGGAELRLVKIRPSDPSATVTSYARQVSANISRKQVRNQEWVAIWGQLESNWPTNNIDMTFGIYERDYGAPPKTFSGSLTYESGGVTTYPSYAVNVLSNDPIISNAKFPRSYMQNLAQTHGHTPAYQTGYGPQFTVVDNRNYLVVTYSLPISCY